MRTEKRRKMEKERGEIPGDGEASDAPDGARQPAWARASEGEAAGGMDGAGGVPFTLSCLREDDNSITVHCSNKLP